MATKTLLQVALDEYGFKEVPGEGSNPEIDKYHASVDKSEWDDGVPWCSSFLNWCALQSELERSNKATAISWLDVGEEVKCIDDCVPGLDILIFHNGNPSDWRGHVNIYVNKLKSHNYVYGLGGNQKKNVCISTYQIDRIRKHGTRRLRKLSDLPA